MTQTDPRPASGGLTMPRKVQIVWGVYLASLFTGGLVAVIGVVMAYVWRGDAAGDAFATSHFARQIRAFWITAIALAIGYALALIVVGFVVILAALAYLAIVSVIGLLKAFDGKSWP
jgi:uncharacterized membrane protein